MKSERIVRGNKTTIPSGADVMGTYQTQAISQITRQAKGNVPIPGYDFVVMGREFDEENQK